MIIFQVIALTRFFLNLRPWPLTYDLGQKKCREGLNVCMNYEFNLLHHVGLVAKRVCAAAAMHEGDDNTPSGPTGRGVKTFYMLFL